MTNEISTETTWRHVHTCKIEIRWGDMDAMGHVNNTVYFRYIEHARVEWMRSISAEPNPKGEGPVIVNAHCSFLKQLEYPGMIEVKTFVGVLGRSSFETMHEIRLCDANGDALPTMYAQGGAKVVWVDFQVGKSTLLPSRMRSLVALPVPDSD